MSKQHSQKTNITQLNDILILVSTVNTTFNEIGMTTETVSKHVHRDMSGNWISKQELTPTEEKLLNDFLIKKGYEQQ